MEMRRQFMLSLCLEDCILDWIRFDGNLVFKGSKADLWEWIRGNPAPMETSYIIWDIHKQTADTTDELWALEKQSHDSKSDLAIFLGNLYGSILREKKAIPIDAGKLQKAKDDYNICNRLDKFYINQCRDLALKRNVILWQGEKTAKNNQE